MTNLLTNPALAAILTTAVIIGVPLALGLAVYLVAWVWDLIRGDRYPRADYQVMVWDIEAGRWMPANTKERPR